MENQTNYSFSKGYGQIKHKDIPEVRTELMDALGVAGRMSLLNYRKGLVEPKIGQSKAIEAVFAKYGIYDIWGE